MKTSLICAPLLILATLVSCQRKEEGAPAAPQSAEQTAVDFSKAKEAEDYALKSQGELADLSNIDANINIQSVGDALGKEDLGLLAKPFQDAILLAKAFALSIKIDANQAIFDEFKKALADIKASGVSEEEMNAKIKELVDGLKVKIDAEKVKIKEILDEKKAIIAELGTFQKAAFEACAIIPDLSKIPKPDPAAGAAGLKDMRQQIEDFIKGVLNDVKAKVGSTECHDAVKALTDYVASKK